MRPRNVHPLCVAGLSATTQRNAMQLIWFSLAWGVGLLVVFQVFGDYLPLLFTSDKQVKKKRRVICFGESSAAHGTCPAFFFFFWPFAQLGLFRSVGPFVPCRWRSIANGRCWCFFFLPWCELSKCCGASLTVLLLAPRFCSLSLCWFAFWSCCSVGSSFDSLGESI